jgi:pyrroloquinoline quinone (PQQ) biosynthesis protein C
MKFPGDIGFAGWKAKGCFAEQEIGNAHIFEAAVSRQAAQKWLIDELPGWFGGRTQTAMAYLAESGKLTLNDVQEAQQIVRRLTGKEPSTTICTADQDELERLPNAAANN